MKINFKYSISSLLVLLIISTATVASANNNIKRSNVKPDSTKLDSTKYGNVLELEETVVTSSRTATSRKLASSIVDVISSRKFEMLAASGAAEVLPFQPGLRVENNCSNCGASALRINGLEGQYSQILIDNRPVFSSLAGVYGLEQLPAQMIERIEVVKGGGSALYGSSAIGGVVNIITKEPKRSSADISSMLQIMDGGAIESTTSLGASLVSTNNESGIYLFGQIRNKDAYDRNGDGYTEIPTIQSQTIGVRGYHKLAKYVKLKAEYHHIEDYRRGGNDLHLQSFQSMLSEEVEHSINTASLSVDGSSADSRHGYSIYASMQQMHRNSYYGAEQDPNAYGYTDDMTVVTGGMYNYKFNKCLFMPATLTIGAEYQMNKLSDHQPMFNRVLEQHPSIMGLYFQNEWSNDKLNLLLGGRLDKHSLLDTPIFSPRVSLRYTPTESVILRASYASGYRAPQAFDEDLHIESVGGKNIYIVLDENLRPEYSNTLNASVDLYRQSGDFQYNLLVEGFYTKLHDVFVLTDSQPDAQGHEYMTRTNGHGAHVVGSSITAKFAYQTKIVLDAGYTIQRSEYSEPIIWSADFPMGTKEFFRSPDQYGFMTLNYNILNNLSASVTANFTGKMQVQHLLSEVIDGAKDRIVETPKFTDVAFRVAYDIPLSRSTTMQLSLGMKNILNQFQNELDENGYKRDAGFAYGPLMPRTFVFGAKFSF